MPLPVKRAKPPVTEKKSITIRIEILRPGVPLRQISEEMFSLTATISAALPEYSIDCHTHSVRGPE